MRTGILEGFECSFDGKVLTVEVEYQRRDPFANGRSWVHRRHVAVSFSPHAEEWQKRMYLLHCVHEQLGYIIKDLYKYHEGLHDSMDKSDNY